MLTLGLRPCCGWRVADRVVMDHPTVHPSLICTDGRPRRSISGWRDWDPFLFLLLKHNHHLLAWLCPHNPLQMAMFSEAVVSNFDTKDQFCGRQLFHGQRGDSFGMIYYALYFYYYYIISTSDRQALDPRGWEPLLILKLLMSLPGYTPLTAFTENDKPFLALLRCAMDVGYPPRPTILSVYRYLRRLHSTFKAWF